MAEVAAEVKEVEVSDVPEATASISPEKREDTKEIKKGTEEIGSDEQLNEPVALQ